jgi:histidine ammonia-lyase
VSVLVILLDGNSLSLEKLGKILFEDMKVLASDESMKKVIASRKAVDDIVNQDRIVYGITTGFGKMSDVLIERNDTEKLQLNLIRSHACGIGEFFPEVISRAMMVLRANALLKGFSGVRPVLIEKILELVNNKIHPVIPSQGSLGASGDLAPLSHLALVLIGEGKVYYKGEITPTNKVFNELGIEPITLQAKEGLALINGTQAMTAVGAVTYLEAEKLAYQAEATASLTIQGLKGITDAYDKDIHLARGYREQLEVAKRILAYLDGSMLTTKQGEERVQDAYSLRCIPQVHGAIWQVLNYVKEKLEIELNAATDNPLIFDDGMKVLSGGNFHGQPIAFAMDFLGIAMSELANISERRIERMVNPQLSNGLPAFLSKNPGLESGLMIVQYSAASLVSENKTLAHPASVDSIPSSANQEDHVSMGTIGARHARQIVENTRRVIAIEMLCALQAVELRDVTKLSQNSKEIFMQGRLKVPFIGSDRIFAEDIDNVTKWLLESSWDRLLIQGTETRATVE